ncbi:unnamed protein product [Effrenium voratum]|nr:unnamed protein product [Effrenium voratum]CAJ1459975.1 unnamed protein product [Effrenium voratum]
MHAVAFDAIREAVGESPAELLAEHQLLEFDEKATCLPNPRLKKVIGAACAGWWDAAVVVDRKVARGPGARQPPELARKRGRR